VATTGFSPINVGVLPGNVRPALFEIDDDGKVTVLARFESAKAAQRFLEYGPRVEQSKRIGGSA
jgi:hypothetical protein